MIEEGLGIKLPRRSVRERKKKDIAKIFNDVKPQYTSRLLNTVKRLKKSNKNLKVKISDLRYKIALLESKNKTLLKKLGDGNK